MIYGRPGRPVSNGMNNPTIKQAIAIAASVLLLSLGYYSSYRPMEKSMLFISVAQNMGGIKTLADFEQAFSVPLDYSSPIGQEELVRNTANTVVNSLQNIPADGVDQIVSYIENYYNPIVATGRGMSFGQDLYLLGAMNELAFLKTHKMQYIDDAAKYFKEAYRLGPKRPQSLYGLFDVYRIKGDIPNATAIGKQILSQWPTDAKVKGVLAPLEKAASPSAKTK